AHRTPSTKSHTLSLHDALPISKTNSIDWDTENGQRVYVVGGNHFVSSNGLRVEQQAQFAGTNGVAAGSYPYFTNVPDELYADTVDRKSTRLNSSHVKISYAVFC